MEAIPSYHMKSAILIADLLSRAQVLIEVASPETLAALEQMFQPGVYGDPADIAAAKGFITAVQQAFEED